MEIVDHSKDGFNIRIDSFILILISCSSSHSKVQSPTVILTVSSLLFSHKSQCTMSALRTPTRKKYVRKRIKTEEASLAGDVYAIPSIPTYPAFHDDQQDPCSAPIRNYIINRRRTAAQQQIISYR